MISRAIKKVNDINERLPEAGRIVLPDSYVRSRLVRAARQVPVYKPVLDRLLITPMNEWTVITSDVRWQRATPLQSYKFL